MVETTVEKNKGGVRVSDPEYHLAKIIMASKIAVRNGRLNKLGYKYLGHQYHDGIVSTAVGLMETESFHKLLGQVGGPEACALMLDVNVAQVAANLKGEYPIKPLERVVTPGVVLEFKPEYNRDPRQGYWCMKRELSFLQKLLRRNK